MLAGMDEVTEPAVRTMLAAINAGDREAFLAALTPDATMSDDGTDRDLREWVDREIFTVNGHIEVESVGDDGLSLIANYRNDTWGAMRTSWRFTMRDGQVARLETGQAK